MVPRRVALPSRLGRSLWATVWHMHLLAWPVLLAAALLSALAWAAGWWAIAVLAGSVVIAWSGIVVHECGHVLAFRALAGSRPAELQLTRAGASLHRPALSPGHEIGVIVAGPLAPALLLGRSRPGRDIAPAAGVVRHPVAGPSALHAAARR
ncbi:hypothetical protein GCM10022402_36630 [Salinactinospora qingdaonensis]|uniref:DUF3267 domain-containing protein n=2 Tax=Salinactinospora qingdaonensis TaxID=702744 RepID=A0ABP7G2L3_9ACTN